jgi:hypothetical protein
LQFLSTSGSLKWVVQHVCEIIMGWKLTKIHLNTLQNWVNSPFICLQCYFKHASSCVQPSSMFNGELAHPVMSKYRLRYTQNYPSNSTNPVELPYIQLNSVITSWNGLNIVCPYKQGKVYDWQRETNWYHRISDAIKQVS